MSPITMAVLGLLAYKAMKNFAGNRPGQGTPPAPGTPGMAPGSAGMPGGLGGLLSGGLGSLLGGGQGVVHQDAPELLEATFGDKRATFPAFLPRCVVSKIA
jgi:hypothetical protein